MEAGDDVGFTEDPAGVVGSSAECGVEERLIGLAEAADVDDNGLLAGEGELAETEAETPCSVVVEAGEAEVDFLTGDGGEVFGNGHNLSPWYDMEVAQDVGMPGAIYRLSIAGKAELRAGADKGFALTLPFGYAMLSG